MSAFDHSDFYTEVECHRIRFVRSLMPKMKLVIPEMDSALKAGQKREITCNYWTTFVKVIFSL